MECQLVVQGEVSAVYAFKQLSRYLSLDHGVDYSVKQNILLHKYHKHDLIHLSSCFSTSLNPHFVIKDF